ncbi:hypothetical protein V6N13_079648 [Hibiscus sabdariffa]
MRRERVEMRYKEKRHHQTGDTIHRMTFQFPKPFFPLVYAGRRVVPTTVCPRCRTKLPPPIMLGTRQFPPPLSLPLPLLSLTNSATPTYLHISSLTLNLLFVAMPF